MPPGWYPDNRNPWRDLYTPEVVVRIGDKIGLTSPDQLDRLGIALCYLAERYIVVQDGVALEKRDRDRANWIEKKLHRPAKHLKERLSPEYERMWSKWPDELFDDRVLKLGLWSQALDELIAWASDRQSWLTARPRPRVKPMTDFKYALASDLLKLYVKFTGRPPTRISQREIKKVGINIGERRLHKPKGSRIQSEAVDFIRTAAKPILWGREENLDDQLKVAIGKWKKYGSEMSADFFIR
jgi:hypothetical protein